MNIASRYAGAALADQVSRLNARVDVLEAQLATEQALNAALKAQLPAVPAMRQRHDHSDGWIADGLRRAIEERDAHWFEDAGRADARRHALRTGQYVDPRDDMPTLAECDRDEADMGGDQ